MPTSEDKNLAAKASITIDAPREEIWAALVDPRAIKQHMFGTDVVTVELSDADDGTRVMLTQDNNATKEARMHSEKNCSTMLEALKQHVEGRSR